MRTLRWRFVSSELFTLLCVRASCRHPIRPKVGSTTLPQLQVQNANLLSYVRCNDPDSSRCIACSIRKRTRDAASRLGGHRQTGQCIVTHQEALVQRGDFCRCEAACS